MNDFSKLRKELVSSPIPFYFNFVGAREDLLLKAIESVPSDICEIRVQKWSKPKPFTHCLNLILKQCLEKRDKCFMFMHYDAQILDESIILELFSEWKNRSIAESTHGENAYPSAFVSACGLTDLLVLYDTNVINDLGGWDTNLKNSFMEMDLMNRCHFINPSIPYPILYPNHTDVPGKLLHESASVLRNPEEEENIKSTYEKSMPSDFEYYYRKWPPGCTAVHLEDKHRQLKEYDRMRSDVICHYGEVEDAGKSINLRFHLEVLKKSQREFLSSYLCRKEIERQRYRFFEVIKDA